MVLLAEMTGSGAGASQPRAQRRCVQKKLSFGSSEGGLCDLEEEKEEGGSEESEDDKKGKRKRKGKARVAAPRKPSHTRTEANTSSKGGGNSLTADASNFFMKVLGKKLHQKQKEQVEVVSLTADDSCKAIESTKGEKTRMKMKKVKESSTPFPCKGKESSVQQSPCDSRSPCSKRVRVSGESITMEDRGTQIVDKDQPALDLWLEAKAAAEENQRLSAGKQIHPFFFSRKTTKKDAEVSDAAKVSNGCCLVLNDSSPPIHVFEPTEKNAAPLDWNKWVFCESSLLCSTYFAGSENSLPPTRESSAKLLSFEGINLPKEISMGQPPNEVVDLTTMTKCRGKINNPNILSYLQAHADNMDQSTLSHSDSSFGQRLLQERLASYQRHCDDDSVNSLWTKKYQPEKSSEVCGNTEAVKSINEWLKSWLGNDSVRPCIDILTESDSDAEMEDEQSCLRNVILVTGPVGCGKSAAIYACAKELGFEVIEINASDQRNGALVKQKFGEAMESHGLDIRSTDDQTVNVKSHTFTNDDPEVPSWIYNLEATEMLCCFGNSTENKASVCQVANKSLILFEDVDTVFDEDRGFVHTILQLAEKSKRPMILTANSKDPVLPQVLTKEVVDFVLPSHEELFSHIIMICAAEEVLIPPVLLKQIVRSCQADIRKTILNLQFWCQGKRLWLGRNKFSLPGPLQFELDAAHLVIPAVLPWELPCKLSEEIFSEIAKLNLTIRENSFIINSVTEHRKSTDVTGCSRITIVSKECPSPSKDNDALFNDSSSPAKFVRRTLHRRHGALLLFNDSDDEQNANDFHNSTLSPDISCVPLSQTMECNNILDSSNVLVDQPGQLATFKSEIWTSGLTDSNICGISDASCIAESLAPETGNNCQAEFMSQMFSLGNFSVAPDDTLLTTSEPIQTLPEIRYDGLDKSKYVNELGDMEFDTESVHENEEAGDPEREGAESYKRENFLMDECSRADFGLKCLSEEKNNCYQTTDIEKAARRRLRTSNPVQGTWRRMRGCHQHWKAYLSTEHKVAHKALKFTCGLTDTISDADIMLSGCESLLHDGLQPWMMPLVQPDSNPSHDEQLEVASAYTQHGLCYFTNMSESVSSELGSEKSICLSQEMLASSSSMITLGKLLLHEVTEGRDLSTEKSLQIESPLCDLSLKRDVESKLCNAVIPMVPDRLCMSIKGHAFHEYLSFLSQISKAENSRLSKNVDNQIQSRRIRTAEHYLKACPRSLSSEDVTLLANHCCFGEMGFR